MKKIFIVLLLITSFNSASAQESQTVKIYADDRDGYVSLYDSENLTDWFQARNYTGDILRSGTRVLETEVNGVRSDRHSGRYRIYRVSTPFDISIIPENADILKASINLFTIRQSSSDESELSIVSHNRDNLDTLTNIDWQISNYGQEIFSEEKVINPDSYTSFELNEAGLNYLTSSQIPVFGFLTSWDFNDILPPVIPTSVAWYSADVSDENLRPYLEITYSLPEEEKTVEENIESVEAVVTEIESKSVRQSYEAQLKKLSSFLEKVNPSAFFSQLDALVKKIQKDLGRGEIDETVGEKLLDSLRSVEEQVEESVESEETEVPLITQVASPYSLGSEDWQYDLLGSGVPDWCGNTIGGCGCAITALTMVAKGFGIMTGIDGKDINPRNLNNWLKDNQGYTSNDAVIWQKALEYFGSKQGNTLLSFDKKDVVSNTAVAEHIENEGLAIGFENRVGHYFTLTDVLTGGGFAVRDPLWFETTTTNEVKDIASNIQGYGGDVDKANLFSKNDEGAPLASMLEIFLASPAELLITDTEGRRAGYDPRTDTYYNEIPGSSYSQDELIFSSEERPVDAHGNKVLTILRPETDLFDLEVIGTGDGEYTLTVASTGGYRTSEVSEETAVTTVGQVDTYTIDIPNSAGVSKAAERLREVAEAKKEETLAERLRSIADKLEIKNLARVTREIVSEL